MPSRVAIDGFGELAEAMGAARSDADSADGALTRVAHAYLDFARDNPAVYDAMSTRASTLHFATQDVPPQLAAAFAELRHAVGLRTDEEDVDMLTEVFWAALHGLATLSRGGRLRGGHDTDRLRLLVEQFPPHDERRHWIRIDEWALPQKAATTKPPRSMTTLPKAPRSR